MAYKRNNDGKFVDDNGALVFSNDIFNQLLAGEHNYLFSPNNMYVSAQVEKVLIPNADDARKYVDIICSKLVDDNGSLASDNKEKELYTKDVKSFMAVVNKICDTAPEDVKNKILGGNFATKDDKDPKYAVPLYLCSEILKAKWNTDYQNTPSETWELFNTDDTATVERNSTLGAQMDAIVEKLKTVDYDKEYFTGDMSKESSDYVAACQFDPTNSIDIYAECGPESCELYATNGVQTYNITMFKVEKKIDSVDTVVAPEVSNVAVNQENVSSEISSPVIGEVQSEIPAVNIITDSNDFSQTTNNDASLNVDIISPSIPMENSDIFNKTDNSVSMQESTNINTSLELNSKYEELIKLREELRSVQAKYDQAFDAYVEAENSSKSVEETQKSIAA